MPEHASRIDVGLYDQQNDEDRIADWGGDDLFTRMPRPRAIDTAPAPRFRPSLVLVDPPAGARRPASADATREPGRAPSAEDAVAADDPAAARRERRRGQTADEAMRDRAERLGLTVVDDGAPAGWDAAAWEAATQPADLDAPATAYDPVGEPPERAANGRRTSVITGRPDGPPRPLSLVPPERRRPPRTPAEWVGARPERIMAWAFVLGLILILVAISTADAAAL